jgi:8-oxo-dGTP diphosphatase/2-hydroxy-dATP diphosphatase
MKEKTLNDATLCFLRRDEMVLLARKKRGIGVGSLNGYGGGIEEGETAEEAAVRELKEETGGKTNNLRGIIINPKDLRQIAIVDFHNTKTDGTTFVCRVYVYAAEKWLGRAEATEEMDEPTWYNIAALPLGDMMLADRKWLPAVLAATKLDKKIMANASYGPYQKELLSDVIIREVDRW